SVSIVLSGISSSRLARNCFNLSWLIGHPQLSLAESCNGSTGNAYGDLIASSSASDRYCVCGVEVLSLVDAGCLTRGRTMIEPLFSRMAACTSSGHPHPALLRAALSSWWVSLARLIASSKTWPL